jgi:hypothetical protein
MPSARMVRPLLVASAVLLLVAAAWQVRQERTNEAVVALFPGTPAMPDKPVATVKSASRAPARHDASGARVRSATAVERVSARPAHGDASQAITAHLPDVPSMRAIGVATAAPNGRLEGQVLQDGYVRADEAERILGGKDFGKAMRDVQADPRANATNAMAYRRAYEDALAQDGSGHRLRDLACSSNICMLRIELGASETLGNWYGAESIRKRLPMPSMTHVVVPLPGGGYEARLLFTTDPGIPGGFMVPPATPGGT